LRASVSTFHLPDRTNDVLGSFSHMPSGTELSDVRNSQNFAPVLNPGGDVNWAGFGNNFPPLPEPSNAPSLIPMNALNPRANSGPFGGNVQQDYGRMAGFANNPGALGQHIGQNSPANMPGFGSSPGVPGQNMGQHNPPNVPGFGSNPDAPGQIAGQNNFANYPAFNSFSGIADNQQFFAGQQDFSHMDNQLGFNTGFSDGSFGANPAFGSKPQSQPLSNQDVANGASQQLFGQSSNPRQRWQGVPPKDQNR
jgi:hypothetical protein